MVTSLEEMEKRTVRFDDLIACKTAFIDARTPGSDLKENFCIIGPGVSENPGQHVHVKIAHGFNIGGARQPKGCVNSQHSHETAEVFLVHSGEWAFRWGENGTDGEVILKPGDVVSFPTNLFRGFEQLSDGDNFLFAILGGDDPGHVTWAPYVFKDAASHGLILTEAGRLIDTTLGEKIPDGDKPCGPADYETLRSFQKLSMVEMDAYVVRTDKQTTTRLSNLAANAEGVKEIPVLGPASTSENILSSEVAHNHGFHFRKLVFEKGGAIPVHSREEEEVVFIHEGSLILAWGQNSIKLEKGDTITIPKGLKRAYYADQQTGAAAYIVRGGDTPAGPNWGKDQKSKAKSRPLKLVS